MKKCKKIITIILCIIGSLIGLFVLDYLFINILYHFQMKEYSKSNISIQGNTNLYVPQGLTYDEKNNVVLQTSYHKKHEISKLFVIDFQTGKNLQTVFLYDSHGEEITGHVGGITTDSDRVWITSDNTVWEFSLEDVLKGGKVSSLLESPLPIRGDFCTYYDGELWIGDFYQPIFWKVKDNTPLLFTYPVHEKINYYEPNKITSLPPTVQGMVMTKDYIYFTHSYTFLNPSKLSIYHNSYDDKVLKDSYLFNGKEVPYYHFVSKKHSTITQANEYYKSVFIPPMAEEFFVKDDKLYFLFESSTDAYPIALPRVKEVLIHDLEY